MVRTAKLSPLHFRPTLLPMSIDDPTRPAGSFFLIFFTFRDGDVWVGSRWNTLSIISLISVVSTAAVGLFAWLSYGVYWGITPELYL